MAGAEASTVAVTADSATSMAPQEISPNVNKVQPQEQIATQGEDGFPSTAKVIGIMFCVNGIMFRGGLVGAHPNCSTRTWSLTMLGPHSRVDSKKAVSIKGHDINRTILR